MGKKYLLIFLVIGAGFALGFVLSKNLPTNSNRASTTNQQTTNQAKGDFEVSLTTDQTSIRTAGEERDYAKIEKAKLDITYKNKKNDIKNAQILLYIEGGTKLELDPLAGTSIDAAASKANKVTTLTVPDAKAGETKTASTYLLSRGTGQIKAFAFLKVNGKSVRTNSLAIKIE